MIKYILKRLLISLVTIWAIATLCFLILHGMEDLRTPVYGAHQLYTALKDLHPELPVRMVLFPHVAHDQPDDPGQLRIYFEELAGWFKKYL